MVRSALAFLPAVALTAATTVPASASDDTSIADQMAEMQRQLAEMKAEHGAERDAMQREIDELRSRTGDNWLTDRRADEIAQVVQDVLADADTRSNLLQDGLMAGWSDHFFLASPDGRFKLELDGHMQIRFVWNYQDVQDHHQRGFENTRNKLTLRGHVFRPEIQYLFRTDATRNEPGLVDGLFFVRDAWIRYQFDNAWALRFGQFKLPFNREELVSSAYQQAVERSLVNENLNIGRAQGVELTWSGDHDKVSFMFSDGLVDSYGGFANIVGGNPVNTDALTQEVEYAVTVRSEHLLAGEWRQFEDMTSRPGEEFAVMLGLAGHVQEGDFTGLTSLRRNETFGATATADLSVEWGGANAFGSFTYVYADHPSFGDFDMFGIVLQGGYYLNPKWEVFARWEYGWWQFANLETSDLNFSTIGVNYYLDGHDLKVTADIGWGWDEVDQVWDADIAGVQTDADGGDPQVVFRLQFQLLF